jgi:hypothetical protein
MPTLAELLNAEAVKQLTAIAADAQEVAADRPKAIRRPSTKKHQPRLTCSAEELVAADKERTMSKPTRDNVVHLSQLSDAELGRMMRSGLLTLVVEQLPEARAKLTQAKAEQEANTAALRESERVERAGYLLPGFTIRDVEVPELDLRASDLSLTEIAPAKIRSPYNRARFRLGLTEPLATEATWQMLATEHKRLAVAARHVQSAPRRTLAATLDETQRAKVDALIRVKGISQEAARALLAKLEG